VQHHCGYVNKRLLQLKPERWVLLDGVIADAHHVKRLQVFWIVDIEPNMRLLYGYK
jgi:hypothetical protein